MLYVNSWSQKCMLNQIKDWNFESVCKRICKAKFNNWSICSMLQLRIDTLGWQMTGQNNAALLALRTEMLQYNCSILARDSDLTWPTAAFKRDNTLVTWQSFAWSCFTVFFFQSAQFFFGNTKQVGRIPHVFLVEKMQPRNWIDWIAIGTFTMLVTWLNYLLHWGFFICRRRGGLSTCSLPRRFSTATFVTCRHAVIFVQYRSLL